MNRLYYGDNLDVMRRHLADESVDLVYLDPPFKSGRDYNVIFERHDETKAAATDQSVRGHVDVEPGRGGRLPRGRRARRTALARHAGDAATARRERHDGLHGHDGAKAGRIASAPQANRQSLSTLRPNG